MERKSTHNVSKGYLMNWKLESSPSQLWNMCVCVTKHSYFFRLTGAHTWRVIKVWCSNTKSQLFMCAWKKSNCLKGVRWWRLNQYIDLLLISTKGSLIVISYMVLSAGMVVPNFCAMNMTDHDVYYCFWQLHVSFQLKTKLLISVLVRIS